MARGGGGKGKGSTREVNCTRRLGSAGGEVVATFNCLGCAAEGDLRSSTCYTNVLKAFVEDVQIDSVILADLNHRQYGGPVVSLLRGQAELIRGYMRAAGRPGAAEAVKNSKCRACPARPSAVFAPVAERLQQNPVAGVEHAIQAAGNLEKQTAPSFHEACDGCFTQTVEAAHHLSGSAVESRAALGNLAYKVSEASP